MATMVDYGVNGSSVKNAGHLPPIKVFCIIYDPDPAIAKVLYTANQKTGVIGLVATKPEEAVQMACEQGAFALLRFQESNLEVVQAIGQHAPVIVWRDQSQRNAAQSAAFLLGGAKVIVDNEEKLQAAIARICHSLQSDQAEKCFALGQRRGLIGKSRTLLEVLKAITLVSQYRDVPTYIFGESGTGKELVARAIHEENRDSRGGPFKPVNCGLADGDLVRSELFGHRKGAFTDAKDDRNGFFRDAQGGTIFLDEVQVLDKRTQAMLLRAIQEKKITPVGSTQEISIENVRVITASNVHLARLVKTGNFREDLYHRLNVFPINLPPLRDRREDIPLLVEHFVQTLGEKYHSELRGVTNEVMEAFNLHPWSGNIRQMQNVFTACVIQDKQREIIDMEDLPKDMLQQLVKRKSHKAPNGQGTGEGLMFSDWPPIEELTYQAFLDYGEAWLLTSVLRLHGGNQSRASRQLKITRGSLRNKMHRLGIVIKAEVG